jgi:hypothetical protein
MKSMVGIIWNTNGVGKETYERIYAPHSVAVMSRLSIVTARSALVGAPQGQYLVRIWWDKGYMLLGTIEKEAIYADDSRTWWVGREYRDRELVFCVESTLKEARAKAEEHFKNA